MFSIDCFRWACPTYEAGLGPPGEVEVLPPSGLTDEWRGGLLCGGGGSTAVLDRLNVRVEVQRNAQEAHRLQIQSKEPWVSKGLADATPG